jgi:hypothetical protein
MVPASSTRTGIGASAAASAAELTVPDSSPDTCTDRTAGALPAGAAVGGGELRGSGPCRRQLLTASGRRLDLRRRSRSTVIRDTSPASNRSGTTMTLAKQAR